MGLLRLSSQFVDLLGLKFGWLLVLQLGTIFCIKCVVLQIVGLLNDKVTNFLKK